MLKNSLKNFLILSLVCISIPYTTIDAEEPSESFCCPPPCDDCIPSSRISLRHIENKGIGYNTGYTTLEGFFAPAVDQWAVMPFLDVRGHVFDNGHWAANAGLGLRTLQCDRVYGAYAYYDYRDTKRKSYNQVSFGAETLGTFWDLRVNGYVVVGNKQSRPYDLEFSSFEGHSIYYTHRLQYALSGANAEVGFYPLKRPDVILYTGIGPYYLQGPVGGAVWGGEARAKVMWKEYIGAELSYSYDHVFKNIVQGEIFLSLPFGPRGKVKESCRRCCIDNYLLGQRMVDPVRKMEIIPITTRRNRELAVDPTTSQAYNVYFVNNLSHSLGTFESPFSTLSDAQTASNLNDIIYVYPGDLTSTGLSDGIILQDGQQLLGATSNQTLMTTLGPINIPPQVSGINAPLLSNGIGDVVTLGNNNVVSGLYIQNLAGVGISANGSNNVTLTQNYIQGNSGTYNGIELDNTTGIVSVSSNTVMYQLACVNINNTNPVSNTSYLFTNNTLHSEGQNYGFNISYTEGSNNYFLSSNNNLYGSGTAGINISCSNTGANAPHTFNISNTNIKTYDNYAVKMMLNNDSIAQLNILDSTINSYYGIYTVSNNQSQLNSNTVNNIFNVYEYAYEPETHNTSTTNGTFTNNSIASYEYAIYFYNFDSSNLNVDINNNIINSYSEPIYVNLNNSSTLTGSFTNNTLNSLDYGIYAETLNSSIFAADITNNVFNSPYYHIEMNCQDSSTYSGNIIGNTFVGQDDDDTIYLSFSTSGNVSSLMLDNIFTGNYDAFDISNSGTGTTTLQILNNIIQNSGTVGVGIVNSGTKFQGTISNNIFQGVATNAVSVSNSGGEMYLNFNNNISNPYPNAYSFTGTGGTFYLYTPIGNIGQISTSGVTPLSE